MSSCPKEKEKEKMLFFNVAYSFVFPIVLGMFIMMIIAVYLLLSKGKFLPPWIQILGWFLILPCWGPFGMLLSILLIVFYK